MATSTPKTSTDNQQSNATVADVAAVAAAEAAATAAAAAAAAAAAPTLVEPKPLRRVFVSGVLADQVNPLTKDRIPHGQPKLVDCDRWVEIQLDAGVLAEVKV